MDNLRNSKIVFQLYDGLDRFTIFFDQETSMYYFHTNYTEKFKTSDTDVIKIIIAKIISEYQEKTHDLT